MVSTTATRPVHTSEIKHIDVVAGLILSQRRLLVCQRHERAAFPLKWEFPGGKVERGETDEAALRRELREELGIEVTACRKIFACEHVYPNRLHVSLRFFLVQDYSGVVGNAVFQQIAWAAVEELPRLDFLEGDLPFIQELLRPNGAKLLES